MKVLRDGVLVKPFEEEKISEGGIHLLDTTSLNKTGKGLVLSVGEGKEDRNGILTPLDVKAGDMVIYRTDAGIRVGSGILLREEDIFAVIEED